MFYFCVYTRPPVRDLLYYKDLEGKRKRKLREYLFLAPLVIFQSYTILYTRILPCGS